MIDYILKIFICCIFLIFCFICLYGIFIVLFRITIGAYYKSKPNNKLQWKTIERFENYGYFEIYYRILPSELPTFVKCFTDNTWQNVTADFDVSKRNFKNEQDFVQFCDTYKTKQQLIDFKRNNCGRKIYIYP